MEFSDNSDKYLHHIQCDEDVALLSVSKYLNCELPHIFRPI